MAARAAEPLSELGLLFALVQLLTMRRIADDRLQLREHGIDVGADRFGSDLAAVTAADARNDRELLDSEKIV
ncbi:MAG: hypothetical protein UZ13_01099 [Chloroflexi bacterium OLB13]|nr:MAG: hypothetical protein UZ13_01099 [Chloroflexi bacterium OLB13]